MTGLSHRNAGVGIFAHVPLTGYLRGLLFTWPSVLGGNRYFPGIGDLLVTALASISICVATPTRAKGHMLAATILLLLEMERASPLFRLLYDHDLLPGLKYFRIFSIYTEIATIGFGVMAALALDGLRNLAAARPQGARNTLRRDMAATPAILLAWALAAVLLWVREVR